MYIAAYFDRAASAHDVAVAFAEQSGITVYAIAEIEHRDDGYYANATASGPEPDWLIPQLRMSIGRSVLLASIAEAEPEITQRIVVSSAGILHRLDATSKGGLEIERFFTTLAAAKLIQSPRPKPKAFVVFLALSVVVAAFLLLITGRIYRFVERMQPGFYDRGFLPTPPASSWIVFAGFSLGILGLFALKQTKRAFVLLACGIAYTVVVVLFAKP